jgi:glucose/arabinose dehydrogenase
MLTLLLALQAIPEIEYEEAFPKVKIARVVGLQAPPDGTDRLFALDQLEGMVYAFDNKPDAEKSLVLDLSSKVRRRGNEEGLLGLAFHPKFKENGVVFLQYSTPKKEPPVQRRNVLSRFKMNAERTKILPESEEIVLEVWQPYENHNGGILQFGPDGYLYLGLGDGGKANDPHGAGQNPTVLLGKFLRIDIDHKDEGMAYAIPKDNPFYGKDPWRPEIWSLGWRNPWGFHFDSKTGELWSGDVGQDKWEEICVVKKGGNYGWNVKEALHEFKPTPGAGPFIDPIVEIDHTEAKSITGGMVYRGKKHPELDGLYFYGDFVFGHMWALRWDGTKAVETKKIFTHPAKQIAIFGADQNGEVYWTSFDAKIYRFKPAGKKSQ